MPTGGPTNRSVSIEEEEVTDMGDAIIEIVTNPSHPT